MLDAAGFDVVLIETVGVGQDEVEVSQTADATVVVLVPGTGDDVQAMKAGIMEIADVFVANKADREGIDRLVQSIEAALSLQPAAEGEWTPPVLKTEATTGRGVPELWDDAVPVPRPVRERCATQRRRARAHARVRALAGELLVRAAGAGAAGRRLRAGGGRRGRAAASIPYAAAHELVAQRSAVRGGSI